MPLKILLGMIGEEWKCTLLDLAQTHSDLKIVGVAKNAMDLLIQAEQLKADAIVLAQLPGGGEPGICSHLMLEYPNVAVLLVPDNPEGEVLWRMVLRKESWRSASKEILLAALKS
jgi:DNA-binding NarL/FixJ family response regulator